MSERNLKLQFKKFRLENLEQCWDCIKSEGLEFFIKNFSNETLTKVFRLIIFSSELPKYHNKFYYDVQRSIENEAEKRNFDCFSHTEDNKSDIFDVVYVDKKIVIID